MHNGRFPAAPPASLTSAPYEPAAWSAAELDPEGAPRTDRRQWLLAMGGVLFGGVVATGAGLLSGRLELSGSAAAGREPVVPRAGLPPVPDWAEQMLVVPEDELIRMAGDYERMSRQHLGDARLAAGFERLLRVAARSMRAEADLAASCAVRSLAKLDRIDIVEAWLPRLGRTTALPRAAAEARRMVDEAYPAWDTKKR